MASEDLTTRPLTVRRGAVAAFECASLSLAAFAAARHDGLELWLLEALSEDVVRGALQHRDAARLARASCGAEARIGPGVLHVLLSGALGSLGDAKSDNLLNRLVRPLLRGISRAAAPAHYFGRDWISAGKRPVALLGFAHEAATQRVLVEAFVAVSSSFSTRARASYLGKEPATLATLANRSIDAASVGDAIAGAYADAFGASLELAPLALGMAAPEPIAPRPRAWTLTEEAPVGTVGVGRDDDGRLRLGGELMASFDAVARAEALLAGAADEGAMRAATRELEAPDVALFGVRSAEVFVDLVSRLGRD